MVYIDYIICLRYTILVRNPLYDIMYEMFTLCDHFDLLIMLVMTIENIHVHVN